MRNTEKKQDRIEPQITARRKKRVTKGRRKLPVKEEIYDQNSFLQPIIESLNYPLYIINVDDYTVKLANSSAYPGSTLPYKATCYGLIYNNPNPCDVAGHTCALKEVMKSGKPIITEHTYLNSKNSPVTTQIHCNPIYDSNNKITHVIEHIIDISGTKSTENTMLLQLEQLNALRTIDKAIAGSLDLDVTLSIIVEQARHALRVDAADILLLRPHIDTLEYAAGSGFKTLALQFTRLKLGDSFAGKAAVERHTVSVADLTAETTNGFKRSLELHKEDFITYYGTPLIAKGELQGVLEVFSRSPVEFDKNKIKFLEALSGQAAIAIDSATLFENLQYANANLTISYNETIEGWSRALDLRDKETEGHSQRVTRLTIKVAGILGVSAEQQGHMRRGALLHDIGKMGIPDKILLKPGKLNDDEWSIMRRHPTLAYELLSPIEYLRPSLEIPYCHHEKWDGTGYTHGLKGEQIPLSARIFAAVDIYDAMTSERPYRAPMKRQEVTEYIRSLAGTHLDQAVVDAFLSMEEVGAV